jgi:hypothetical protein
MDDTGQGIEADIPTESSWADQPRCSSYISPLGTVLGYVQPGAFLAHNLWFGYIAHGTDVPVSAGATDREEAKRSVEEALELYWNAEIETARNKKGRRR